MLMFCVYSYRQNGLLKSKVDSPTILKIGHLAVSYCYIIAGSYKMNLEQSNKQMFQENQTNYCHLPSTVPSSNEQLLL